MSDRKVVRPDKPRSKVMFSLEYAITLAGLVAPLLQMIARELNR